MVKSRSSVVMEYGKAILIAVLIALFIRTFIVQAFKIPSGSMKPTLLVGDWLLVNKFIYGVKLPILRSTIIPVGKPERGDTIVFIYPLDRSKDFIKRVIGIGGDTVEVRDKIVYVNEKPMDDPYGVHTDNLVIPKTIQPRDQFGPVKVPEGSVFVMGDNRDQSYDSRFWGFVDLKDILGKAFIIYWSWDGNGHSPRWDRFGKWIH